MASAASSFFSFLPFLELDLSRLGVFSPSGLSVALTFSLIRADRLGVSPVNKLPQMKQTYVDNKRES
jgi:hypothetical protein